MNIRRIMTMLLAILIIGGLTGCHLYPGSSTSNTAEVDTRFISVSYGKSPCGAFGYIAENVYYDKYTKVMYVYITENGHGGGLSPLYNIDGSLLLYEE